MTSETGYETLSRLSTRHQRFPVGSSLHDLSTGGVPWLHPPSFFGIPLLFTLPRFCGLVDSSLRRSPGQFIVLNLMYQASRAFAQRLLEQTVLFS
jgi:hypothetical protein